MKCINKIFNFLIYSNVKNLENFFAKLKETSPLMAA